MNELLSQLNSVVYKALTFNVGIFSCHSICSCSCRCTGMNGRSRPLADAYLPSALPYHLPTPDYFLCQGTVSGSHSLRRHSGEIERGPGRPPRIRSSLNSMTQQKTSFSLITGLMHLAAAVYCGTCKKRRIRTMLNILSIYMREKKCHSTPSYKRPNALSYSVFNFIESISSAKNRQID